MGLGAPGHYSRLPLTSGVTLDKSFVLPMPQSPRLEVGGERSQVFPVHHSWACLGCFIRSGVAGTDGGPLGVWPGLSFICLLYLLFRSTFSFWIKQDFSGWASLAPLLLAKLTPYLRSNLKAPRLRDGGSRCTPEDSRAHTWLRVGTPRTEGKGSKGRGHRRAAAQRRGTAGLLEGQGDRVDGNSARPNGNRQTWDPE